MIDARQAVQLLKNTWRTPFDLAQQIVSLATSSAPRTVEAPVTIRVPEGQTALKIAYSPRPVTATVTDERRKPKVSDRPESLFTPSAPTPDTPPPTAAPIIPPPIPSAIGSPVSFVGRGASEPPPLEISPSGTDSYVIPVPPTQPPIVSQPTIPDPSRTRLLASLAQTTHAPKPPEQASSSPNLLVASVATREPGPELERPDPPRATPATASGLRPTPDPVYVNRYEHPQVDITGPAFFGGPLPVQFEQTPVVFNPKTKEYRPIVADPDDDKPTRIPAGQHYTTGTIGKVKSGTGETWVVTIYPDGKPPNSGNGSNPTNYQDFNVTVPGAGPNYLAPVDKWIGPLVTFADPDGGDDKWFYLLPTWAFKRIAKTGVGGIPKMVAGVPQSASVDLYTFDGTTAPTLDVAGVACYHLDATNNVGASKFIQVVPIEGRYFADWEAC